MDRITELETQLAAEKARADKADAALNEAINRADNLDRELVAHREKASGNYWAWQGDEEDHLELLSCPVVILPDALRCIVAAKDKAEAEIVKFRSESWISDAEVGLFQDRMRNEIIRLTGCPQDQIDGKGSDAGWEEFTLAEIGQGIAFILDRLNEARAACAAKNKRLLQILEVADLIDDETGHQSKAIEAVLQDDCGKVLLDELAQVRKERDEARAACGEMRAQLEIVDNCCCDLQEWGNIDRLKVRHCLSTDCGKGWLSPAVREKARATIRTFVDAVTEPSFAFAIGCKPSDKLREAGRMAKEALALLDGKGAQ